MPLTLKGWLDVISAVEGASGSHCGKCPKKGCGGDGKYLFRMKAISYVCPEHGAQYSAPGICTIAECGLTLKMVEQSFGPVCLCPKCAGMWEPLCQPK